jgi:hypothetical protein
MNTDPKDNYKRHATRDPRNIDDTYIFDPSTGIYKPKAIETDQERARKQAGTNRRTSFFTDNKTDWRPVWIATVISLFTVALLGLTVRYSHKQWIEMIRSADATTLAANAATSAAQTAQQSMLDNRALYRPAVVVGQIDTAIDGLGAMHFRIIMKNATNFTATNCITHCKLFENNKFIPLAPGHKPTNKPYTVGPQEQFDACGGMIGHPFIDQVNAGTMTVDEYITATYDGPIGSYSYCAKAHYDPVAKKFGGDGDCDLSKPFPQ